MGADLGVLASCHRAFRHPAQGLPFYAVKGNSSPWCFVSWPPWTPALTAPPSRACAHCQLPYSFA